MILDLDIGNSRCKWRLTGGQGRGVFSIAEFFAGDELPWGCDLIKVHRVRVCSVRSADENQLIALRLERKLQVAPEFATPCREVGGLLNGYVNPESLGVDRWLAMLGARIHASGPLIVADAGTALTVDCISADGQHLGGYILPGREQMLQALNQNTQRVRVDNSRNEVRLQPGRDTASCVSAAATAAARGCVLAAAAALPANSQLILCGGDAAWLAAACADVPLAQRLVADLVLDGLALSLPAEFD